MVLTTGVYAQKLNKDTMAKYSNREAQLKVFNKIATQIHLDASQTENFDWICSSFTFIAIAIIENPNYSSSDRIELLKITFKEYKIRIKEVLNKKQINLLKVEAKKTVGDDDSLILANRYTKDL